MATETLEALFVQREDLAQRIVELIRESALTLSRHYTLLIGPRGIGKTHLIALAYHRIRARNDLRDRLLIAWLREEEWGVTSFLDLLLRIFRAIQAEYNDVALAERIESLYNLPPDAAERVGASLLKEFVGDRTLLILVENLDDLFEGLDDEGQKRLRAYLQENPFCTILATAQSLFNGVSLQTSPFYGFFRIHHLEELNFEDARHLLANIANLDGDRELASFIQTPMGRARIRAVHHLAGGNHRVYVIFSQFLTRQSLNELTEPFIRTLDDLTPYYQARIKWLSSQQRKIVEFLCDCRHAVPVKEIAQRCFMTHQTTSGQLKTLREMGYVRSIPIGRESYYELREPLMRLCIEVKKQRGEPIRLFIDFLRFWYSRTELQQWLALLQPDATLEREYVFQALRVTEEGTEDPRVAACLKDYKSYVETGDFTRALEVAEELVEIRGHAWDWFAKGTCLGNLGRYDEALASFDKAIEFDPNNERVWYNRGVALGNAGHYNEALLSFDKATELDPENAPAWVNQGAALVRIGRHNEALVSFNKAIKLDPKNRWAWDNKGRTLIHLKRWDEALVSFDKVIKLDSDNVEVWYNRGWVLAHLERWDEALVSFDKVIELNPKNALAWGNRGVALGILERHEEAFMSFDKVVELDPKNVKAWFDRGIMLAKLRRWDEALASFDKAIEFDPNDALAWYNRGVTLGILGRWDEALAFCDKAIELGDQSSHVFFSRAEFLLALNRWNEGIAALDDALYRFAHADESDTGDTDAIVRNLFTGTHDTAIWQAHITTLIELYNKHRALSALGQGLVQSFTALISPMVSDEAARTWHDVWQELAGDLAEFQIPLRLLDAALRYRETHNLRVLLELPVEERTLLESLLGIEELPRM
ncbi:MAG: tetratricopeptide repeat protein [Candidatus Tectomicrobia bacterium]|nr:tetratricopeptide repeat protein [Candidatus Tectomicrobia bacterium]